MFPEREVLLDTPPRIPDQGGAQVRAPAKPQERFRQRRGISGFHRESAHPVFDQLGHSSRTGHDNGNLQRHRLQNAEPQRLFIRRQSNHVGRALDLPYVVLKR
jgi:hypothetical protein